MKPLIKHSVTLFILLLVGYSQLFAHLYCGCIVYPSIKSEVSDSGHSLVIKTTRIDDIFIEEEEEKEEERFSLRSPLSIGSYAISFFDARLQIDFFDSHKKSSSYQKHFSYLASTRSPYLALCVFRL